MNFNDRLGRRDNSALESFKEANKRGVQPTMEDNGPPSRDIEDGVFDPTKRDLGFQKEALEKEVYGEHFTGKKEFVKEKENYYRDNHDIQI